MKHLKVFEEFFINKEGELIDDLKTPLESLDLDTKNDFKIFVNIVNDKWKGSAQQSITHAYKFEIPIKYEPELKKLGLTWGTRERVTNKEHPKFGQEYIEFSFYTGNLK